MALQLQEQPKALALVGTMQKVQKDLKRLYDEIREWAASIEPHRGDNIDGRNSAPLAEIVLTLPNGCQELDLGYDAHGYQRKHKVAAVAKCPSCHQEVALVAETEEWEQRDDATWEHVGWGPASGVCCNNLIVEFSEGYDVYPLPPKRNSEDRD